MIRDSMTPCYKDYKNNRLQYYKLMLSGHFSRTHQTLVIRWSLFSTIPPAPASRVSTSTIFFIQLPQVPAQEKKNHYGHIAHFTRKIYHSKFSVSVFYVLGSSRRPISNMQVRKGQLWMVVRIEAARVRFVECSGAVRRSTNCCIVHAITYATQNKIKSS